MDDLLGAMPLNDLLSALAAKSPAPGGGAAAGVIGATAAALGGMVVAYSQNRRSLAEHHAFLDDANERLERARALFVALADADAAGYTQLNRLMKLPEDDAERRAGWDAAVNGAIAPPRATLAAACDLLRLLEELPGRINPHLKSDLGVAAVAGQAAARAASWNVRVNAPLLDDQTRASVLDEATRLVADASARAARIEAGCA
jgi:formiminotetrahydrofolate cyclodeaminase